LALIGILEHVMSDLKLSIVIISLNEEIRLPLLLDDLSAQT
jgi:hypothetical protein